jgi:hypothetical protein
MVKLMLLAVLAGLGWWYFDGSRRLSEDDIRAAYQADLEAMQRFDADSLCARMSEDFAGEETARQGDEVQQTHYDKKSLCARIRQSLTGMQQISASTRSRMGLEITLEVTSIELSTNRKEATVETVSTMRLGDMTLARDRTTEHLIRRNGRILSTGGDSRVWAYAPQ